MVAPNRIKKAKLIEMAIPCIAEETKAFSEIIQTQPNDCILMLRMERGALFFFSSTKLVHLSNHGFLMFAGAVLSTGAFAQISVKTILSLTTPTTALAFFPSSVVSIQLITLLVKALSPVIGKVSDFDSSHALKSFIQHFTLPCTIKSLLSSSLQTSTRKF